MAVNVQLSRKCMYALQAMFELAFRKAKGPVKVQDIASAQAIPQRFLEVILAELKHGSFVESKRGNAGGYFLARPAEQISVGEVIGFLEGYKFGDPKTQLPSLKRTGAFAFARLWQDINAATSRIYSGTMFTDLVKHELETRGILMADYAI